MDGQTVAGVLTALAAVLTALNAGKLMDAIGRWWTARQGRHVDATEVRKTTRVLLETIELKNQEMAMKDRMLADRRADLDDCRAENDRRQEIITQQRDYIARRFEGGAAS